MVVKYQPQLLWKEFKEYGHLENNDSLEDNMEQKAEWRRSTADVNPCSHQADQAGWQHCLRTGGLPGQSTGPTAKLYSHARALAHTSQDAGWKWDQLNAALVCKDEEQEYSPECLEPRSWVVVEDFSRPPGDARPLMVTYDEFWALVDSGQWPECAALRLVAGPLLDTMVNILSKLELRGQISRASSHAFLRDQITVKKEISDEEFDENSTAYPSLHVQLTHYHAPRPHHHDHHHHYHHHHHNHNHYNHHHYSHRHAATTVPPPPLALIDLAYTRLTIDESTKNYTEARIRQLQSEMDQIRAGELARKSEFKHRKSHTDTAAGKAKADNKPPAVSATDDELENTVVDHPTWPLPPQPATAPKESREGSIVHRRSAEGWGVKRDGSRASVEPLQTQLSFKPPSQLNKAASKTDSRSSLAPSKAGSVASVGPGSQRSDTRKLSLPHKARDSSGTKMSSRQDILEELNNGLQTIPEDEELSVEGAVDLPAAYYDQSLEGLEVHGLYQPDEKNAISTKSRLKKANANRLKIKSENFVNTTDKFVETLTAEKKKCFKQFDINASKRKEVETLHSHDIIKVKSEVRSQDPWQQDKAREEEVEKAAGVEPVAVRSLDNVDPGKKSILKTRKMSQAVMSRKLSVSAKKVVIQNKNQSRLNGEANESSDLEDTFQQRGAYKNKTIRAATHLNDNNIRVDNNFDTAEANKFKNNNKRVEILSNSNDNRTHSLGDAEASSLKRRTKNNSEVMEAKKNSEILKQNILYTIQENSCEIDTPNKTDNDEYVNKPMNEKEKDFKPVKGILRKQNNRLISKTNKRKQSNTKVFTKKCVISSKTNESSVPNSTASKDKDISDQSSPSSFVTVTDYTFDSLNDCESLPIEYEFNNNAKFRTNKRNRIGNKFKGKRQDSGKQRLANFSSIADYYQSPLFHALTAWRHHLDKGVDLVPAAHNNLNHAHGSTHAYAADSTNARYQGSTNTYTQGFIHALAKDSAKAKEFTHAYSQGYNHVHAQGFNQNHTQASGASYVQASATANAQATANAKTYAIEKSSHLYKCQSDSQASSFYDESSDSIDTTIRIKNPWFKDEKGVSDSNVAQQTSDFLEKGLNKTSNKHITRNSNQNKDDEYKDYAEKDDSQMNVNFDGDHGEKDPPGAIKVASKISRTPKAVDLDGSSLAHIPDITIDQDVKKAAGETASQTQHDNTLNMTTSGFNSSSYNNLLTPSMSNDKTSANLSETILLSSSLSFASSNTKSEELTTRSKTSTKFTYNRREMATKCSCSDCKLLYRNIGDLRPDISISDLPRVIGKLRRKNLSCFAKRDQTKENHGGLKTSEELKADLEAAIKQRQRAALNEEEDVENRLLNLSNILVLRKEIVSCMENSKSPARTFTTVTFGRPQLYRSLRQR